MLSHIIFYIATGIFATYLCYRRVVKEEEIVLHDPHADDFNKDIWED